METFPGCVLFEHVPKAAGSTLNDILRKQYDPARIYFINGANPKASLDAFKRLASGERRGFDLIAGHWAYQLREYARTDCAGITMLREPVDRIASHYHYVLRHPKHYLFAEVTRRQMGLLEYATSGISGELENYMTWVFSKRSHEELRRSPDRAIQLAVRNLDEHFLVAGLTECFDQTVLLLKQQLHWPRWPWYIRTNVTRRRPKRGQILSAAAVAIRERNKLDLELYAHAQRRFARTIAAGGAEFERQLKRFARFNALYNLWGFFGRK